jgi:hypothetical protein
MGTEPFRSLAATAAAAASMPHVSMVLVGHPLGGVDPKLIRDRAEGAVDAVIAALTRDPALPARATPRVPATVEAPDDLDELQLFAMARGWSDGLPVLPPTAARVARLVAATGHAADAVVVPSLAPAMVPATVEAIAINAAMTGAAPEHMAVILAALRAVADPAFNLNAIQTTTHPCTPLLVVNGPIVRALGISGGANALGNGHRANAVIGRAVRLTLQNVGGARAGETDRATLGHAGKFTYCLAENEAESPWEPLHVERGFGAGESTVTVLGAAAPTNVNDHGSMSASSLLKALAGTLAQPASNNIYYGGEALVIVGPEHARTIADSGWSKHDLKCALYDQGRVRMDAFSAENIARYTHIIPGRFDAADPAATVTPTVRVEDVMIIVAGGPGKHSSVVPTFGATRAVTARIES